MNLEANRNFLTGPIVRYEGEEFDSHLEKRSQGIDKQVTPEDIAALRKSPAILPNLPSEDRRS